MTLARAWRITCAPTLYLTFKFKKMITNMNNITSSATIEYMRIRIEALEKKIKELENKLIKEKIND